MRRTQNQIDTLLAIGFARMQLPFPICKLQHHYAWLNTFNVWSMHCSDMVSAILGTHFPQQIDDDKYFLDFSSIFLPASERSNCKGFGEIPNIRVCANILQCRNETTTTIILMMMMMTIIYINFMEIMWTINIPFEVCRSNFSGCASHSIHATKVQMHMKAWLVSFSLSLSLCICE